MLLSFCNEIFYAFCNMNIRDFFDVLFSSFCYQYGFMVHSSVWVVLIYRSVNWGDWGTCEGWWNEIFWDFKCVNYAMVRSNVISVVSCQGGVCKISHKVWDIGEWRWGANSTMLVVILWTFFWFLNVNFLTTVTMLKNLKTLLHDFIYCSRNVTLFFFFFF